MRRAAQRYPGCMAWLALSMAGCVPLAPATRAGSSALLEVRLNGRQSPAHPLIGLLVSVDAERGGAGRQLAFEPQVIAADHADFRVHLDLPAGRYLLRRLSGVMGGGVVSPQFDVAVDVVFEVRAGATSRLARIEIGNAGSERARRARTDDELAGTSWERGSRARDRLPVLQDE